MRRKLYGEDKPNPDVARSLNNLADALKARGDRKSLDEAIGLYKQSLEMRRKLYGEDKPNPDVATSLNNLAAALQARGDRKSLDEAIGLHKQSLEMRSETLRRGQAQPRRGHVAQ